MSQPNEPETAVMFRVSRGGATRGVVYALFPDVPGDPANAQVTCALYSEGRRGSGCFALCVMHSRPAKPEQYAALKRELEGLGYRLRIVQRAARHSLTRGKR